jgi:anti-anti-sigma factor
MSRAEALAGHGSAVVVVLDDHSLLQGLTDLRWRLDALMTGDTGTLILDVTGLERLSSATLAAMLWAQRTCQSRGGRVIVRGPNRRCREMLTRTGLATVFEVRPAGDLPLGTGRSSTTPTGGNA